MEGIEQIEALHAKRAAVGGGMDEEAYLIAVCDLDLKQRIADALDRLADKFEIYIENQEES